MGEIVPGIGVCINVLDRMVFGLSDNGVHGVLPRAALQSTLAR
jgi:hypothetical protein